MNCTANTSFHTHRQQKIPPYSSSYTVSQVLLSVHVLLTMYKTICCRTVVTKSICDQAAIHESISDNPLPKFCSPSITSDALLDLVARFGDYNKISNNQAACLYYGLTSRQLKLKDDKGIALGECTSAPQLFVLHSMTIKF